MCDFISWVVTFQGETLFLTDQDVFSSFGREKLLNNRDNDILGHGAIRAFYGSVCDCGTDRECTEFWKKERFPAPIATHLKSPNSLLKTWGRILRKGLRADDASYILCNAPPSWRKALENILFRKVVNDPHCAYDVLCRVKNLTSEQKNTLITAIVDTADAPLSFNILRDVRGLSKKLKNILVKVIAKDDHDGFYFSWKTLRLIKGLTKEQKKLLKTNRRYYC